MRKYLAPAAPVFLAVMVLSQAAMGAGHVPTRKAAALPVANAGACSNSALLAHAAYVPGAPEQAGQCGHLLSTDTLLKVHRWAST